jgi:N-methylhydantoinase A/oxoprolinase/acetone carboxylase beta subunit
VGDFCVELGLTAGILQRENATILNAALLSFARSTVAGFQASTRALDLACPLFLTSNDGTLMTCEEAERFPIKTFSSGPTNSMRGANFLASLASGGLRKEPALVMDVGGTTVSRSWIRNELISRPRSACCCRS